MTPNQNIQDPRTRLFLKLPPFVRGKPAKWEWVQRREDATEFEPGEAEDITGWPIMRHCACMDVPAAPDAPTPYAPIKTVTF